LAVPVDDGDAVALGNSRVTAADKSSQANAAPIDKFPGLFFGAQTPFGTHET